MAGYGKRGRKRKQRKPGMVIPARLTKDDPDPRRRFAYSLGVRGPFGLENVYVWERRVVQVKPGHWDGHPDRPEPPLETVLYRMELGPSIEVAIRAAEEFCRAADKQASLSAVWDSLRRLVQEQAADAERTLSLNYPGMIREPTVGEILKTMSGKVGVLVGSAWFGANKRLASLRRMLAQMPASEFVDVPYTQWDAERVAAAGQVLCTLGYKRSSARTNMRSLAWAMEQVGLAPDRLAFDRGMRPWATLAWSSDSAFRAEPADLTIDEMFFLLRWADAYPEARWWGLWTELMACTALRTGSMGSLHQSHIYAGPENRWWIVQRLEAPVGSNGWTPKRPVCVPIPEGCQGWLREWIVPRDEVAPDNAWLYDWVRKKEAKHAPGRRYQRASKARSPRADLVNEWWQRWILRCLGEPRRLYSVRGLAATWMPGPKDVVQAIGGWASRKVMDDHYVTQPARPIEMVTAVDAFRRSLRAQDQTMKKLPIHLADLRLQGVE